MSESKLRTQSMDFAVSIINLVKYLKEKRESIVSNQIGRSGTSIGANIREAQYAHGKADFIAKLQIALKEANETGYWLELLFRTKYIDEQTFKALSTISEKLSNAFKVLSKDSAAVFNPIKASAVESVISPLLRICVIYSSNASPPISNFFKNSSTFFSEVNLAISAW